MRAKRRYFGKPRSMNERELGGGGQQSRERSMAARLRVNCSAPAESGLIDRWARAIHERCICGLTGG